MSDRNYCECGAENPYRHCRCNSASVEPCSWCDWNWSHECPEWFLKEQAEAEEQEDEEDE